MNADDNNLDPRQQADDRVIHALLQHLHNPHRQAHQDALLHRLHTTLTSPPAPPQTLPGTLRFPSWARRSTWAALAAVFAIAITLFVLFSTPHTAVASLNDILTALNRPGDRLFAISVDPPDPQFSPRPGLDRALLYLRNGTQYLLVRPDIRGGNLFDGFDGTQSWRISGGNLAETRQGLGAGGLGIPDNMTDTVFSDLQPTLSRITTAYTVDRFDMAPLPPPLPPTGPQYRHFAARRNSPQTKGPVVIEVWANPATGMPHRIFFGNAKFQGSPDPRQLTFDLLSESPLPADWFTPAPHLANNAATSPVASKSP